MTNVKITIEFNIEQKEMNNPKFKEMIKLIKSGELLEIIDSADFKVFDAKTKVKL